MTPPLGGAISSIAYAALSKNFFYYKAADPYAHAQNQDAVIRLAEVPGLGIDSAQQVIAEVGVTASTFSSAAEFTSWVGTCPGRKKAPKRTPAAVRRKATNTCAACSTRPLMLLPRAKAPTFRQCAGV